MKSPQILHEYFFLTTMYQELSGRELEDMVFGKDPKADILSCQWRADLYALKPTKQKVGLTSFYKNVEKHN